MAIFWIRDSNPPDDYHMFGMVRSAVTRQTCYQHVQIADSEHLGRCLILDGRMQSAEVDEYIYHEALVHPALLMHPHPRRVLVLGGGEGATPREVLRHRTVEEVTMVDLDEELVVLCREHLPWVGDPWSDPRLRCHFGDAYAFVEDAVRRGTTYDVIISDLTDPTEESLASRLYTREFYALTRRCLTPPGVFATQAFGLRYDDYDRFHAVLHRTLSAIFPLVHSYLEYMQSFDCMCGFAVAAGDASLMLPRGSDLQGRLDARVNGPLRYYDAAAHERMFALPRPLRDRIAATTTVADEHHPIAVSW